MDENASAGPDRVRTDTFAPPLQKVENTLCTGAGCSKINGLVRDEMGWLPAAALAARAKHDLIE
ncbi:MULTISPECIES: hypothetical protein [Bradyrhizobium]|uniref:hypothetical protein n=1 Tax=Bradyrhizobium TaxID=374 RepID=UPI00155E8EE9|nr:MULTISPECIES: hypothetical protein [Bradyrhizobium]UUO27526.1 hypothetical protein DCG74_09670 [Bradyrhizobium sp. WBAH42]